MSHPPPDRFHRHFQILYALERYLYIPFALFTILLKYVRLSQGIRKLCGTPIIPRLTAIHRIEILSQKSLRNYRSRSQRRRS